MYELKDFCGNVNIDTLTVTGGDHTPPYGGTDWTGRGIINDTLWYDPNPVSFDGPSDKYYRIVYLDRGYRMIMDYVRDECSEPDDLILVSAAHEVKYDKNHTAVMGGDPETTFVDTLIWTYVVSDPAGNEATFYLVELLGTHTQIIIFDENSVSNEILIQENNNHTSDVVIKRDISPNRWNTIVLPFAMTAAQLKATFGDDVKLAALTGGDAESLIFTALDLNDEATTTTAGQPYAIHVGEQKVSIPYMSGVTIRDTTSVQTVGDWQFVGTYSSGNIPAGSYFFSNNQLWQAGDASNTILSFRAYLTYNGMTLAPQLNFIIEGENTATGVKDELKGQGTVYKYFRNGIFYISRDGELYDVTGRKVK